MAAAKRALPPIVWAAPHESSIRARRARCSQLPNSCMRSSSGRGGAPYVSRKLRSTRDGSALKMCVGRR